MAQAQLRVDRLNGIMEGQGLESSELADKTGLSYNYIYLLRRGDRPNVSAVNLAMMAAAMGCSVEYLVGLTDNPLPAIGQDVRAVNTWLRRHVRLYVANNHITLVEWL